MNKPNPQNEEEKINDPGEVMQKVFEFTPQGLCKYRQQGPYLICVSCEVQHATYIGMDRLMIGEDEMGHPILKNRGKQA